jgi:adenine-specific DNA-methyltransferase
VVDGATRDRLIAEHSSSVAVLKPFLRGRDVKRWRVEYADLWLLYIPWHFPLHLDPSVTGNSKKAEGLFSQKFPAIYEHLRGFKKELSSRNAAETGIRYEWQ